MKHAKVTIAALAKTRYVTIVKETDQQEGSLNHIETIRSGFAMVASARRR